MLEHATSVLKEKDKNGNSVYNHIVQVVEHILENKQGGYEEFESISATIKKKDYQKKTVKYNPEEVKTIREYNSAALTLSGRPVEKIITNTEEDVEPEEEIPPVDINKVANVLQHEQMLRWAGIDFKENWWLIQCCCVELAKQFPNIIEPRFFGTLTGMKNNYYIVETKLTEYPEKTEEHPPQMEAPGQGVNEYVYFACNNLTKSEWVQLPYLEPKHIKASQECRIYLQGEFDAPVGGRWQFPGSEGLYVRTLIARIVSSTTISPSSYFVQDEENENPLFITKNEEYTMPENVEDFTNWVHTRGHLRMEGRLIKYEKPIPEDEEEAAAQAAIPLTPEEEEEIIPILRSIKEDNSDVFTTLEDDTTNLWYTRLSSTMPIPYRILTLKHKLWPGAVTAMEMNTGTFVNLYVGNGLQFLNKPYVPQSMPPILNEFEEYPEIEDPSNPESMIKSTTSMFVEQDVPLPPVPEKVEVEEEENEANNNEEENNEETA